MIDDGRLWYTRTKHQDKEGATSNDKTEEVAQNNEGFPVTITDDANREVTIERET